MSNIALQIASFINQLKILSQSQKHGLENMADVIRSESEATDTSFASGVALGAFVSWGVINIEKDIIESMEKISEALAPLGLNHEIEMLLHEELFKPSVDSDDILPDLKRAQKIITRRLQTLSRIEKSLLSVPEKEILEAYSPETLSNFQNYWDGELRQLVDNV